MTDRPKPIEWVVITILAVPGAFLGVVAFGYALEILMGAN